MYYMWLISSTPKQNVMYSIAITLIVPVITNLYLAGGITVLLVNMLMIVERYSDPFISSSSDVQTYAGIVIFFVF